MRGARELAQSDIGDEGLELAAKRAGKAAAAALST
jgi:hypothetical protein